MAHRHMEEKVNQGFKHFQRTDPNYHLPLDPFVPQERMAKEKQQRQIEKELDPLAPFQARLGQPEALTFQEALQLKTDCLTEFKQQLNYKISLIHSRIEKAS